MELLACRIKEAEVEGADNTVKYRGKVLQRSMADEDEEEKKAGHGLFRRLLAINYYEVVEPIEYTAEPLELRKVPNSFASAQVILKTLLPDPLKHTSPESNFTLRQTLTWPCIITKLVKCGSQICCHSALSSSAIVNIDTSPTPSLRPFVLLPMNRVNTWEEQAEVSVAGVL